MMMFTLAFTNYSTHTCFTDSTCTFFGNTLLLDTYLQKYVLLGPKTRNVADMLTNSKCSMSSFEKGKPRANGGGREGNSGNTFTNMHARLQPSRLQGNAILQQQ